MYRTLSTEYDKLYPTALGDLPVQVRRNLSGSFRNEFTDVYPALVWQP